MLVLKDHARIRVFVQGLDLLIDVDVNILIMEGIVNVRIIHMYLFLFYLIVQSKNFFVYLFTCYTHICVA